MQINVIVIYRYLIILFTDNCYFYLQITGIAILALGIWIKVDLYKYMELSSIYYKESPFILIGVGVVIVLVGSLGCCCTIKGNAILLYMVGTFVYQGCHFFKVKKEKYFRAVATLE